MKTSHFTLPIVALLGCLASGCVTHTTVQDEPRQSVRFTSSEAAQTFYDAYLSVASPKGHGSVALYVALPYWHRTVATDNVHFNSVIQSVDADHDAVISDEEARAYESKVHSRLAQLRTADKSHHP